MPPSNKPKWTSQPPRVGDVITCLYPNDPKGELRPVLVLETRKGSEPNSFSVRAAYGTKSLDKEKRGAIDIIVDQPDDIDNCGLAVPTRFDLEETATILWEPPDCNCWRGRGTPIIGTLPFDLQIDAAHKLKAIQDRAGGKK